MGYEIFDDIICITLEGNTDRQKLTTETLSSLNIPFRFYVAKRNPRGGRIGCFESHINVIQECYNNNYQRILIFEDDIIQTPSYSNKLVNIGTDFMKTNTTWEVFKFGNGIYLHESVTHIFEYFLSKEVTKHIYNYSGVLTHAYCLSRSGMEKILKNAYNVLNLNESKIDQIDIYFYNTLSKKNSYSLAPMIFDQRWCQQTDNIPKGIAETLFRKYQCFAETMNLFYCWSLLLYYRLYILIIILITMLFIIMKEFKKF
jgi:GR25 family glycosyltransferase involved in LPS biosynthesis